MGRNDGTVQGFDLAKLEVTHHCSSCDSEQKWHIRQVRFEAHDPTNPATWSLVLPDCPGCAARTFGPNCPLCGRNDPHKHSVHHSLNCSLPDNHPHPSAQVIKALITHLGAPRKI